MKFTFASLMLLLAHALIGVPLSAHVTGDTASAEVDGLSGAAEARSDPAAVGDIGSAVEAPALAAFHPIVFAASPQVEPAPVRAFAQADSGMRSFDLPLHWGSGDRHALDEGKP